MRYDNHRPILIALLILAAAIPAKAADDKCASLTSLGSSQFPNKTTVIRSAVVKPVSEATTDRGATPALPEHCELFGE